MARFRFKMPRRPVSDPRARVREALERDNPELAAQEFAERDLSRAKAEAGDAFARIELTDEDREAARRLLAKRRPRAEAVPEPEPPKRRRFRLWG